MALYSGKNARVRINKNTFLSAFKWSVNAKVEEVDVSAFEDGPFMRYRPGMHDADVSIEAFWEDAIHSGVPPNLVEGQYITVELYLNPDGDFDHKFYFPLILITSLAIDAEVRGLVKYTFNGKSDGPFGYPGKAVPDSP